MYNYQLETFVCVADSGSFSKAGEKLYISATAVMKQINSLESHLKLKLIERTPRGVFLTPAGEVIYKDAKFLFDFSKNSIEKARQAMNVYETTFRIGSSILNPINAFMDLWYKVSKDFNNCKIRLVPFEDNHEGIVSEISQLGEKFDFIIGVCDSKLWLEKCNMVTLGSYRVMCAVSRDHYLAENKELEIKDLYGQTLMMIKDGDSEFNDLIRKDLTKNHPEILIENTAQFYDVSVFNRCEESGNVLLTLECWKDVHPSLVTIPVNWDYKVPYGLLYSLDPSENVMRFVEEVKSLSK